MNRLELIKKVCTKVYSRLSLRDRLADKTGTLAAKIHIETEAKKIDKMLDKLDSNHNHHGDSSSYIKEFYGSVYHENITRSNDWN